MRGRPSRGGDRTEARSTASRGLPCGSSDRSGAAPLRRVAERFARCRRSAPRRGRGAAPGRRGGARILGPLPATWGGAPTAKPGWRRVFALLSSASTPRPIATEAMPRIDRHCSRAIRVLQPPLRRGSTATPVHGFNRLVQTQGGGCGAWTAQVPIASMSRRKLPAERGREEPSKIPPEFFWLGPRVLVVARRLPTAPVTLVRARLHRSATSPVALHHGHRSRFRDPAP